jgi:hypothetical protein
MEIRLQSRYIETAVETELDPEIEMDQAGMDECEHRDEQSQSPLV